MTAGNIGEVLANNHFTVDNSVWHSFSPYGYPLGWPLLLAPLYATFGRSYALFKLLEVAAFCAFLIAFYAIARRRTGPLAAFLLSAAVGASPSFIGATDTVLSDLPYLCFVGLTLWFIDLCREEGMSAVTTRRLVVLGLLMAFTFNIRREGIALVVALAALHLTVLGTHAARARSVHVLRTVDWKSVWLPYATFAAAVATFQLVLPTAFLPQSAGTALSNVPGRYAFYQDIVAEHVGLKTAGRPMEVFGSYPAARRVLALLTVMVIVGVAVRLLLKLEQDVHLVAYLCCTTFLMLISPYQEGRYLFTITPLLLYFAVQALPGAAELFSWRKPLLLRLSAFLPVLGIAGLVALNSGHLARAFRYHSTYQYTIDGPESAGAKAMFQAVQDLTRSDDVILFFRARAMTFYSQRRAIQGPDLDQLLPRVDWYVMRRDSTYSQTLLSDDQAAARRMTKAWAGSDWVIWRVPRAVP